MSDTSALEVRAHVAALYVVLVKHRQFDAADGLREWAEEYDIYNQDEWEELVGA